MMGDRYLTDAVTGALLRRYRKGRYFIQAGFHALMLTL
jgi:hypothetical protein